MPQTRVAFLLGLAWLGLACGGGEAPKTEATPVVETPEAAAPAKAPDSTPAAKPALAKPKTLWVVVTATATNKPQAKEMRAHFLANTPGPADVRVYSTDDLPGLKPGLFLVSPVVARDKASADHLIKNYEKVFEGTYAREVPESAMWDVGFTTFGSIACTKDWQPPECAADGRWRALVSVSNSKLPPNATGYGQFDGQEVGRAKMSGVPVFYVSLPGRESVDVLWRDEVVATVDLTLYEDLGPGSLYMMEGKEPAFMPYRLPSDFDVRTYWGFTPRDSGGAESYGPDAVGEE